MTQLHKLIILFIPIISLKLNAQPIDINGNINKVEWKNATTINGLYAPWEDEIKKDNSIVQYFIKDGWLYYNFQVQDTTLLYEPYVNEKSVPKSDRVEIFFAMHKNLKQYYCFEIDSRGNKLDYHASYHRIFDQNWDFSYTKTATKVEKNKYIVEGAIHIKQLDIFNSNGKSFYMAIFRADYGPNKQRIWYSAKNIKTRTPDFHLPKAFFKVKL
ncbi:sugar-binding protein [Prolixibacteraceae bacterium]|nr:sugar-binding protein [Prolixibacteraceae bacterium]